MKKNALQQSFDKIKNRYTNKYPCKYSLKITHITERANRVLASEMTTQMIDKVVFVNEKQ